MWTGAKRIGVQNFVDEYGQEIEKLDCNLFEGARFIFPSQMTALITKKPLTPIFWSNSQPGNWTF